MIISCNISGVPRIIHTNVFVSQRRGLNLLIEPKLIISPSGRAKSNVSANIFNVIPKPFESSRVTEINFSITCVLSEKATYLTSVSLYFSARAGSVPSSISSSIQLLNFSAISEPFLKPTPYSSEVRVRPMPRSE